jgi:hypothetical protein
MVALCAYFSIPARPNSIGVGSHVEETSGANDGFDGFARKSQLLRASADSPFSGNHSLAGDAPGTGDGVHAVASAANNRRRGAAATMLYKDDTSAASNKRSRAPARYAGAGCLPACHAQ